VNSYAPSALARPGGDKCQGLLKGQLRALAPFFIVLSALHPSLTLRSQLGAERSQAERRGMGGGGGRGATEADAGGGRGGTEERAASLWRR
jgi:hypothetical protein